MKENLSSLIPSGSKVLDKLNNTVSTVKKYESQYSEIKSKKQKLSSTLKSSSTKSAKSELISKREKTLKVLGNVSKTMVPIIAMFISQKLSKLIEEDSELELLVEETNEIIDNATTKQDIQHAKLVRNNALTILNNAQGNIEQVRQYINTLRTILQVYSILITIITALPIPTSVPPGVGIPVSLIMKLVNTLQKSLDIVAGINVVLSIVSPILQRLVDNIEDLKNQLHELNQLFENTLVDKLTDEELTEIVNEVKEKLKTNLGVYKGFKLVLKQENNTQYEVKGNKRHYAVALNSDGNIVAFSDYSFTLNPDVLVEQLKIKIDQLLR